MFTQLNYFLYAQLNNSFAPGFHFFSGPLGLKPSRHKSWVKQTYQLENVDAGVYIYNLHQDIISWIHNYTNIEFPMRIEETT